MIAHKVEAIVDQNGSITITNLPFATGESIEIILVSKQLSQSKTNKRTTLKGQVLKYSEPFDPVVLADWEALV